MNENRTAQTNGAVRLEEEIQKIRSRLDLVKFIQSLDAELRTRPDEWENRDLDSYLEAMAAWVEYMDGYYLNRGEPVPETPTWATFAQILLAARVYE